MPAPICRVLSLALTFAIASAAALPARAQRSERNDTAVHSSTYSPELNTGRDALRQIVQDKCILNWQQKQDPAPCERVSLADAKNSRLGVALLADRKGGAHYLLIPTQTMAGIDSSELLDPDTPNYFAQAWHARDLITGYVGHPVARTAVGLAVNTARSRTQDQFHIHIECLRQDVIASLAAAAAQVSDVWTPLRVADSTFQAQKIVGEELEGTNPFELLAHLKPDVRQHMGDYTLLVAGMQFKGGPGFIVLAGTGLTGELLLDSSCAAAGGGG